MRGSSSHGIVFEGTHATAGVHCGERRHGGAKPGDIPFQQQTKFELILNRAAAASLGLGFPATLLAAADEVMG
jgi:putative ABC transport system substrate-binding protein